MSGGRTPSGSPIADEDGFLAQAREQALNEMRLADNCHILGRVIAWVSSGGVGYLKPLDEKGRNNGAASSNG